MFDSRSTISLRQMWRAMHFKRSVLLDSGDDLGMRSAIPIMSGQWELDVTERTSVTDQTTVRVTDRQPVRQGESTMISQDARSLPAAALEELRRRAVAAVEAGGSRVEVARLFGVSRRTVGSWVLAYRDNGEDAFRSRPRGRRSGEQLALSVSEQETTIKTIVSGRPKDAGLAYQVWAKPAIAEFVNREFRVTLSTKTVGRYLIRWGLVPSENLLELLRGHDVLGSFRTPGPGQAADTVWLASTRPPDGFGDINTLLAMSNRGTLYFDAKPEPFDADQIADFLRRLVTQTGHALDVVLCQWPGRQRSAVRNWPNDLEDRLLARTAH